MTSVRSNQTVFFDQSQQTSTHLSLFAKRKWLPRFSKGDSFRATAFHCEPFVSVKNGTVVGIEPEIVREATRGWPLDYLIILNNGTESLRNGSSQTAMCSQWPSSSFAEEDLDPTVPYEEACLTFLVPKPPLLPGSTFVFQPFQARLWLLLALSNLTMGLILHIVALNVKPGPRPHPYTSFSLCTKALGFQETGLNRNQGP